MLTRLRLRKPSPALVISCLALFVALSGTSYAVIKLPKNSVGTKHLKKNAVTSAKVKNNTLTGADVNEATLVLPAAPSTAGLEQTVQALQARVTALEASLDQNVEALQARVAELEGKLAAVSYDDAAKVFRFDGVNVQIVNGTGDTFDPPNGFGNLIVGYNEGSSDTRTGSHNVVVGPFHTYTSSGGLVAGYNNNVTGAWASVSGGSDNTASGQVASVSGGRDNTASGPYQWLGGTLNVRTVTVNVPGGDGNNAHWNTAAQGVLCDPGHLLLSGGAYWNTDVDGEELPLIYSRALDALNGWRARGGSDLSSNRTLTVQALCLGP